MVRVWVRARVRVRVVGRLADGAARDRREARAALALPPAEAVRVRVGVRVRDSDRVGVRVRVRVRDSDRVRAKVRVRWASLKGL